MELIYKDEAYMIMGACFHVHNTMGCGFLEGVYQECLGIEFERRDIPSRPQAALPLTYEGIQLQHNYIADFVCFDRIIVEIKAASKLCDEHRAQVLNYLHATGHKLGLLINFGAHPQVEWERIALDPQSLS